MSTKDDVAAIKAAFETAEADAQAARVAARKARRSLRDLHNLCAGKMAEHAELLGLSPDDVIVFGGGTPKEQEEGGEE